MLADCPAHARSEVYGGDPQLDRLRLTLTYHRLRGLVADDTAPRGPVRVFEVGYGSGALLRRFLDAGAEVAGADPGALGVDPDERVAAAGQLHRVGVEEVPRGDGYDLVYAVHVVEHVADPALFLAACSRLLRPGGVLAIVTPAGDSDGLAVFGADWWMLEDPTHVRFFSAASLRLALIRAGLGDVRLSRPVLDSVSVEVASGARWITRRPMPGGILQRRSTRVLAAAAAPLTVTSRLVRPRLRPSLQAVARVPERA
jgi:SAM-dependent methyltransferase